MANEKRLIDAYALFPNGDVPYVAGDGFATADKIYGIIKNAPTVDAVPVDDILLHHILIDENGIPEVKLQFGDRTLVLRREGDPVDAVEVVHGRWETHNQVDSVFYCSVCKLNVSGFERRWLNYCPNCGAMMDGGKR